MSWILGHWREIAEVVAVVLAWVAPSPVKRPPARHPQPPARRP